MHHMRLGITWDGLRKFMELIKFQRIAFESTLSGENGCIRIWPKIKDYGEGGWTRQKAVPERTEDVSWITRKVKDAGLADSYEEAEKVLCGYDFKFAVESWLTEQGYTEKDKGCLSVCEVLLKDYYDDFHWHVGAPPRRPADASPLHTQLELSWLTSN